MKRIGYLLLGGGRAGILTGATALCTKDRQEGGQHGKRERRKVGSQGNSGGLASLFCCVPPPATDLLSFFVSARGLGQWFSIWCHSLTAAKGPWVMSRNIFCCHNSGVGVYRHPVSGGHECC